MDGFEPIRKAAVSLHMELTSMGVDPLKPMDLVMAALRKLDLELVWLAPDNPTLKGARAVFDEQSGTVICAMGYELGERAELVAHEIGHVVVHTTSSFCGPGDINSSRSTETAPVGLQRVEDYGAHERRELQANVFSREFLFPRALARRLHLDERFGVGTLVVKTGLPKNLIRQQIFDALLLPFAPDVPDVVSPRPPDADPSQDRAAAHRGSPFQLQAGPGTGKTRTLVKRVLSLLADGIDPTSILVLTFSNRAAGELAERLTLVAPDAAPRIWIGTFHAFGLDLVRRYHDTLGLSPDPTLFDRSDAIEVLEEILPTLPLLHYRNLWDPALVLRDIVAAISRAKDEMTDPARYRALAQVMLDNARDTDSRVAAEKCLEVAQVYELYEKALKDHGAVAFGDLIMRPALLLESSSKLARALQLRHRHVLVDEYQDVNRASGRLLKAVAGDGKRLWVVGDSRQSIYRFRGASSANMAAFSDEYNNVTVDQLSLNYRSTKQIVDTLKSVAPRMGASQGMLPLAFTSNAGSGPLPEIRNFATVDDESEGIAASIRELEDDGIRLSDQAVLCRSNRRLNEIAVALEDRGIPVLHLGSLFEREEVRDLLALLSLVVDRFGDALARVGAMARYRIPIQDIYLVTQHLRQADKGALETLPDLHKLPGITTAGSAGLARLAQDFQEIPPSASAWEFLSTYLLDRSELIRELAAADSVSGRMRSVAVWQLLNFVREQRPTGSGFLIRRTLDRVRQLVLRAEERDLRQVPAAALHMNAVRLMTVHGSKGLEFGAVHIPGLTVASFPLSNRGPRCPPPVGMISGTGTLTIAEEAKQSQEREEECLFFVALSRARKQLRLYRAQLQANGNNRKPSPYLAWISIELVREIANPATLPLPPGLLSLDFIKVTYSSGWHVTHVQLGLYEKCPLRFFYTHILGLGSARKPTAFSQTHDCLYDLIDWLADTRRSGNPTVENAETAFEAIWQSRGPTEHGFAGDYRRLASRLIRALVQAGAGQKFRETQPLAIDFPNGRVIVEPDEMNELPNGTVILRRVRTGQKRSDEYDRLDYTLYQLAGETHFGARVQVHALHLADETSEVVEISPRKVENRKTNSDAMLRDIAAGRFPVEPDAVACPRCPHFFICPAVPKGTLVLP